VRQEATGLRNFANLGRAKSAHAISVTGMSDNFEAFTGPLVDQCGKWVRFEIRINREGFEYIVKNELYNQKARPPSATRTRTTRFSCPSTMASGMARLKSSWPGRN
jgi:hypothetical protein